MYKTKPPTSVGKHTTQTNNKSQMKCFPCDHTCRPGLVQSSLYGLAQPSTLRTWVSSNDSLEREHTTSDIHA